ncbi:MAG: 4-hydroxy-tetrahydrodipicolinate reductase [Bacteroidia bacterium]|nr:4-hydroxy-tetrahydrodipicolinate reductase [Bacteroidia bacterium]MBT8310862.1 4-hydroxy-tetrahydrodipicolinate reductase [Bacteroidia bacterium]NND09998.1 4-hydroxy-tetrahydrodipicolinate reductase [Flavobacteriaceae bacterium]NNK28100.1 4-hydroxy-tetrahydrodipicolinate reductase [Flavobacteriaceae bacterium]NNL61729.1 4-hydroxy-tetrahydrodipicolinate reductase [Flavobacteriaceae bacterium]
MKIALLGYGRMGKEIEQIALDRGHTIVVKVDENTTSYNIKEADVAIDFSIPSAAVSNISNCLNNNVPVISGTTGWLENYDTMVKLCNEKNGAFLYASNFSLGVNIVFEINKHLAKLMKAQKQYALEIEEIHHTQKLDAPSGTAISLAEDINDLTDYTSWSLEERGEKIIPITSKRIEGIPGTHIITYRSAEDSISLNHTANSRKGFALGAVIAAEWIIGKTGVFSMKDVLNIG